MKNFILILLWISSLVFVGLYTYKNPEKIEISKSYLRGVIYSYLKKNKNQSNNVKVEEESIQSVTANSFLVEFSKIISISGKTAFISYESNNSNFNIEYLKIYTQDGRITKNSFTEYLDIPDSFTQEKNGGVKTIFKHKKNEFALISSLKNECYYASIVLLNSGKEIFSTECLPSDIIDFNGLGSSNIHFKDKILLSIGTPEQISPKIRLLAQDNNSVFGKILEISKNDLDNVNSEKEINFNYNIFSNGHRNPQGLTKIKNSIFSAEHGPKGGDELNLIIKDKNYGWPVVSYGTRYLAENDGKSHKISHENNNFEEPLFAHVPSFGLSGLNTCPAILKEYYKKPCLLGLSLYGYGSPGRSILIYLLNNKMNKVHSVEKIYLRDDFRLRHFVTNSKNELYEDENGSIYVSVDLRGIYKISFKEFRN